jgi:hypothetical protein
MGKAWSLLQEKEREQGSFIAFVGTPGIYLVAPQVKLSSILLGLISFFLNLTWLVCDGQAQFSSHVYIQDSMFDLLFSVESG